MRFDNAARRRGVGMLLLATLLASGCSSARGAASDADVAPTATSRLPSTPPVAPLSVAPPSAASSAPPTLTAATSPTSWPRISQSPSVDQVRRLTATDFELAVPDDWSVYALHPDGQLTPLGAADALRVDLQSTAMASAFQGARLFAVSSSVDAIPVTLMLVGLGGEPARGDGAPEQISDELVGHLAGLGITDVEVRNTQVAGLPAAEATYRQTATAGDDVPDRRGVTVFVPRKSGSWILTMSGPATGVLDAIADQVVASFEPR